MGRVAIHRESRDQSTILKEWEKSINLVWVASRLSVTLSADVKGILIMKYLFGSGAAQLRQGIVTMVLAAGMMCGAGVAQAATIGSVIVGDVIYEETSLDVIADDTFIEASAFNSDTVFVSAFLDGSSNAVPGLFGIDADLDITDINFFPVLLGVAHDVSVDTGADTISILYKLSENTLSFDPFALAVLFFDDGVFSDPFNFTDVDFAFADLKIYGATSASVVPLPAGLPLLLVGLGGFAVARRFKKRTPS
ncbi:MAG: VPLPA-CTERM sorting domain-containing protein [Paracoccaceae bacterium]|nr:VPLPA-CTERM sorting domain-containing protein [Paracoccaceae bacterium]